MFVQLKWDWMTGVWTLGAPGMHSAGPLAQARLVDEYDHSSFGAGFFERRPSLALPHRAASKDAADSFAKSERERVVSLRGVEPIPKGLRFFVAWVRHSRLNQSCSLQGRARTLGCGDANFMAESSQRLGVRHEGADMACALRRGKQNSHVTASPSDLRICDQLRRKCREENCANRKGRGALGSDLSKAKGSVVE